MATGHGYWRDSQPFECQSSPQQQPSSKSASDLLQSYIDKFSQTQHAVPQSPALQSKSWSSREKQPHAAQLPLTMEPDRDTLELLCGSGKRHATSEPQTVSLGTRRILRNVDKQLSHLQPWYSATEKLDLRTLWPSMHEHMERRWNQQLRTRYEAQQMKEAASAEAAKAAQGTRADMYESRWHWSPRSVSPIQRTVPPPTYDCEDNDDTETETKKEKENESDGEVVIPGEGGGSLVEATARSDEEDVDEEEAGSGRPWGSDSGVGLSCLGVGGEITKSSAEMPEPSAAADPIDHDEDTADEASVADHRSFEDRMRSYRCVLEAHELSAQLRQRLEVACASGVPGARALTADQKGHIRERLTRLQHPCPKVPAAEGTKPAQVKREDQQEQTQERITTERLSRLMSGARSLLTDVDERGSNQPGSSSQQRLSDSLAALELSWQQKPKQRSLHQGDDS